MNIDELNRSQRREQAEKGFDDVARAADIYYRALIANNLPDELARQMVLDFYRIQWIKSFFPDTPPPLGN